MLASLGLILLCQLIGEAVVHGLGLPMPGPVLGLLLLLILLLARDRFALLARGPCRRSRGGARWGLGASKQRAGVYWRICRCCSCRPGSASCRSSICSH